MIYTNESEMLFLKEELRNCRLTQTQYHYISDEEAYNEYVEAYKEYKSIDIKDKDNFKKYIGDFLRFQFNNQVLDYYDNFTLYVSEDENYTLEYGYNKETNVYEVSFIKEDGTSITLNKSLEYLDEQLEYEFDSISIEFDEDETTDLDEFIEENKEQRIEIFEYEYVCEMIEDFINECLLNHN